ncbi:hypothetical protein J1N35_025849 [Gossypium stocksii]|uniref:Uncharacterized protein n=1 Tax=Gossypium stocksii TaxID=47602 RepID=A0A9D3V8K9_9ROSI|nr:hypothetical protein J1N35_025849 [Gossypium stocksii]
MSAFPSCPKELLSDAKEEEDDEVEVDEIGPTPTHFAIEEKATQKPEEDEEKTELVSIEIDLDGEEANPTSAPPVDDISHVSPQSTTLMTQ